MRKFKNRDRPRRMSWLDGLITCIAILAVFGVVGALGGFGSLFKDKDKTPGISTGDVDKPSVDDPDVPGEDDPTVPEEPDPEPIVGRGNGKYANAEGVLDYTYEGDTSDKNYDFGFVRTVASYEGNNSSPVVVDGNACWEISRSNVTESKVNTMTFTPVTQVGNKYVFETDFLFEGCSYEFNNGDMFGWIGRFEFIDDNGSSFYILWDFDTEGNLIFKSLRGNYVFVNIPQGEWCNIRFEMYDSTMNFYLNGKLYGTAPLDDFIKSFDGLSGEFASSKIESRCYIENILFKLDNTYVSAIN